MGAMQVETGPRCVRRGEGGWSTTAQVAAASEELGGWVARQFRGRLSVEDARDVAWEALLEAQPELESGRVRCPQAFLRRAARHNALDAIRKRDGYQASGPRPTAVPYNPDLHADHHREAPEPTDPAESTGRRVADLEALMGALEALPSLERQALTLRHIDGLNPATCQLMLGLSLRQWRRLHPRALRRLRATLAATQPTSTCTHARTLVRRGLLSAADAIRRDSHLEACLPCRAYQHLWQTDPADELVQSASDPATAA